MPTRRAFLQSAALAALQPARRPNIVLMMADDLGLECLGCYGGESYRTPNLDRLAARGVRFTHAYSQPLCTPTRTQLMTGKYTHRNWRAFGILDPSERTFGHMMKEAGYRTAIVGKWQLFSYNPPDFEPEWRGKGMRPEQSGFEEYCLWHTGHTEDKGSRYARPTIIANGKPLRGMEQRYGEDVFCDYALDFIGRNAARPFFLYYPMALTHDPFNPTPRSPQWKDGNRLENHRRFFGDMVEYMDHTVGRVAAHLEKLGLAGRTLLLFYSDNGTHQSIVSRAWGRDVRGGKGKTTEAGIHVPLIASWPGSAPARVAEGLVDSTDFLSTLAEAAGASTSGLLDGRSFLPQVLGRPGGRREWSYCPFDPKPGWNKEQFSPLRFAHDRRFKLYDSGRLFDFRADELEQRPLAPGEGGPETAAARRKLQKVLDSYQIP